MAKIFMTALCLSVFSLSGQNANRYYPSLKNLFPDVYDKQMPSDFNYYDVWFKNVTQAVFYKDLQQSASPRGDASFMSMGLIFKRLNQFKLGDSGLEIVVNQDKPDFSTPVNIQMEQKFRILAYLRSFDPNTYNPNNFKQKFELGLTIYNLSEEQVLAEFINRYLSDWNDKKQTAIERLVNDLKKEAHLKIIVDEKKDQQILKSIATQVYQQTQKYCSSVLYDIYIKTKDAKAEATNFNAFFRKYANANASDYIDDIVSYQATIAIPNQEISLLIPKNILNVFTTDENTKETQPSAENLRVNPIQIEMNTIRNTRKKCVEFTLTLPKSNSLASFKAINEIALNKNPILPANKRTLNTYKVADIQKIIIAIFDNEIEINMLIKDQQGTWNLAILKQPYQLN